MLPSLQLSSPLPENHNRDVDSEEHLYEYITSPSSPHLAVLSSSPLSRSFIQSYYIHTLTTILSFTQTSRQPSLIPDRPRANLLAHITTTNTPHTQHVKMVRPIIPRDMDTTSAQPFPLPLPNPGQQPDFGPPSINNPNIRSRPVSVT